jgi:RNA polymerase sigma-70 factor (ECF subfamily)
VGDSIDGPDSSITCISVCSLRKGRFDHFLEKDLRIAFESTAFPYRGQAKEPQRILIHGSETMQSTNCPMTDDETAVSDRELINMALSGDQIGYEQLLKRYQDRLYTAMWGNVGCPVLAEDIVQEAFVRAFLHLRSFRSESNFYTWLYRIALNSRRKYFRARVRTIPLDVFDENVQRAGDEKRDSPSALIERREDRKEVIDALERLDEGHRTILVLREFDGFDYQTIAEVLNVKMGTVRSRLSRARAQLRQELALYQTGSSNLQPAAAGS